MEDKEIKEQIVFVKWLKSKNMYNKYESWMVMQKMFVVYKECKKEIK